MVPDLASQLDAWALNGRATLGETAEVLGAYGLNFADARELAAAVAVLGWPFAVEDAEGNAFAVEDLHPDFAPYRASITKPAAPAGVLRIVTLAGFREWLEAAGGIANVQIAMAGQTWETRGCRFGPWRDPIAWTADPDPIPLRRIVREISNAPVLPTDLRPWILRDPDAGILTELAYAAWADASARHLVRAMSNEVETPEVLLFRGPPVLRLEINDDLMADLGADGFRQLQTAAAWVFESPRDLETRHGFFSAEVPRSAPSRAVAGKVLAQVAGSALEGAKIAYQLHLSQISRDTLKAMTDLRKGVADETGKLAESTRSVVNAVAAAALGGVGLIAARLTLKAPQWPVVLLALVLSLHVLGVVWTGWRFLAVQRELRSTWRGRLYAFLPEGDFRALVTAPVQKAETAFAYATAIAAVVAVVLVAAALLLPGKSA